MHSGWKNIRRGTGCAKHRRYSACIHALRYIRRYLACACPTSFPLYHLQFGGSFCASSRFSRTTIVPLPFFHLFYPRPLRPESCSCEFLHECKRRPGRLYELFQFTSTNCRSFLHFPFFFSLSLFLMPPFLPLSFSRLRVRGHEPYRGNSTFVFVFRRRRWQSRKNRQDERNNRKEKCRE